MRNSPTFFSCIHATFWTGVFKNAKILKVWEILFVLCRAVVPHFATWSNGRDGSTCGDGSICASNGARRTSSYCDREILSGGAHGDSGERP